MTSSTDRRSYDPFAPHRPAPAPGAPAAVFPDTRLTRAGMADDRVADLRADWDTWNEDRRAAFVGMVDGVADTDLVTADDDAGLGDGAALLAFLDGADQDDEVRDLIGKGGPELLDYLRGDDVTADRVAAVLAAERARTDRYAGGRKGVLEEGEAILTAKRGAADGGGGPAEPDTGGQ